MKTIQEAFEAGRDCGMYGADTNNCHYTYFATKKLSEAHLGGFREGEKIASDRFKE